MIHAPADHITRILHLPVDHAGQRVDLHDIREEDVFAAVVMLVQHEDVLVRIVEGMDHRPRPKHRVLVDVEKEAVLRERQGFVTADRLPILAILVHRPGAEPGVPHGGGQEEAAVADPLITFHLLGQDRAEGLRHAQVERLSRHGRQIADAKGGAALIVLQKRDRLAVAGDLHVGIVGILGEVFEWKARHGPAGEGCQRQNDQPEEPLWRPHEQRESWADGPA